MNYKFYILFFLLTIAFNANATHNRAGEITYRQIGALTIEATITTYTKASSTSADRDSLTLNWGDGTSTLLDRDNGNGDIIPGQDIKINYYRGTHTYASRASYTLSFQDPNRVNSILNVNYPNSVEIPFYLETTFTLLNSQFEGLNNSVLLLQPPLDFACLGQRFIHNPTAYDADGDSISYELIIPMEGEGIPVSNYQFPDEIGPNPLTNVINLDEITGDFVWNAPQIAGEYNIALKVKEHRNGQVISSTVRDMQIFVDICDNQPPILESIDEICVIAGEKVDIQLNIDDVDEGQQVILSATGGPFFVDQSKAVISGPDDFTTPPFTAQLIWQTNCSHIREQFYQVVIRAQDDFGAFGQGLVTLKTIRIKVLGPPPENLETAKVMNAVMLSWNKPYLCDLTASEKFVGFSVWRKEGSNPNVPTECFNGLNGMGYEKIEYVTNEFDQNKYIHLDEDVDLSKIYCYRVLAEFAELTDDGVPFNRVESIASEESCIQLTKDVPFITKVSVLETSNAQGMMDIAWQNPKASDFDTLLLPGPYQFELLRAAVGSPFQVIQTWNEQVFSDFDVTTYEDSALNTADFQYLYQVLIKPNGDDKISSAASSVYLNIQPNDKRNILSWDYQVPWQNFMHYIYRYSDDLSDFELIDSSLTNSFTDFNLENGQEYCYYVSTVGTYGIEGFPTPIVNDSQENCAIPVDLLPPCAPSLSLFSICDLLAENPSAEELFNTLSWSLDLNDCPENEDVMSFNIYSLNTESGEYEWLAEVPLGEFEYEDFRENIVSGCYKISALDEVGNESLLSEEICAESCAIYELPNTYTPNGDGSNDFFVPRKNLFIESVNFTVYNRWGNLIFETNDPMLNWDGLSPGGEPVDDGTYYYVCELLQTVEDELQIVETLEGYIEVLR